MDTSEKFFGLTVQVTGKDAILKEKDRNVRALAGHLLAYGLGRELSLIPLL